MKEIKEETKREVTDVHTYYEAVDGTRFTDIDECRKYEESVKCIVRAKVNKLIVSKDKDAWELMGGCDDHTVVAFKPSSQEDVDTLKQFLLTECPWYKNENHKELREKKFSIMEKAFSNDDILLFGLNCDDEYYFINSRLNIINNLNNLDKKEDA